MASQYPQTLFDYYLRELELKSTPATISAPKEQWFQPLKTLPNHPTGDSEQSDLSRRQLSLELDRSICNSCSTLVSDCLARNFPSERWRRLGAEYDAIAVLVDSEDDDGRASLKYVAKCAVCNLKYNQLYARIEDTKYPLSKCSVFAKPQESKSYQFFVCERDVSRFARHMSAWYKDQAKPLKLFKAYYNQGDHTSVRSAPITTILDPSEGKLSLARLHCIDPRASSAFTVVCQWYQDCLLTHQDCKWEQSFLPKRVIDLKHLDFNNMVYLYLPSCNDKVAYATISYTWGESGFKRLKTKNHDLKHPELTEDSHRKGISVERFPKTLQDAIRIAKRIGFQYLWIDSVCIVQDSHDDWAEQSAAMTQIYGGARLNISATSSENSEWGIMRPTQQHGVHIGRISVSKLEQGTISSDDKDVMDLCLGPPQDVVDLEDKCLASRGWVFQERLVSPATLHYTDEGMMWECAHGIQMESDQDYRAVEWKRQWKAVIDRPLAVALGRVKADGTNDEILSSWNSWIESYAERKLYDFKDRLYAIAGVAKTLSATFGLTYAAGLWQEDVVGGLMWKRFNRTETLERFAGDTTPTWSWASVQGRLEYMKVRLMDSRKGPKLQVIGQIEVAEERPGSFGRVLNGCIKVEGMLQQIIVDKTIHPGVRQRPWEEVGIKDGFVNPANVLVMLDQPFLSTEDLFPCWCLRLGSYDDEGREADLFLVLEEVDRGSRSFRRVGFIETDAWSNSLSVMADSGALKKSAEFQTLVLV